MKEVAINLSLKNYKIFDRPRRMNVYSRKRESMCNVTGAVSSLEYWEESSHLVNLEHELLGD